jgi:hypothetical protein
MQFALIISGADAPAPAPRCAAVPSETGIGVYEPATGEIWRPDDESLRAALPARLRRYVRRESFLRAWFEKGTRFEGGRCSPSLPFLAISNARGARVATVYLAPVADEAAR